MAQVYNSQLDAFDLYHQQAHKQSPTILGGPALPALGHALAGSTGAAIANVCTYPLDLIITRLQIQRQLRKDSSTPHEDEYRSVLDAASKIYSREGGLAGFYAGCISDTAKTIADSFLFFLAYNFVRQSRLRSIKGAHHHLPVLEELSVGFVAGAFSKLFTTPLGNVVTRLQTASMVGRLSGGPNAETVTARSIASGIRAEKGLRGFWSGYSASLVLTLNPSLTFFFFETFKQLLLRGDRRANPPAQATFLIAAVSKALASSITYPFSLAKARAQTSAKMVPEKNKDIKEGLEKISAGRVTGSQASVEAARHTVFGTILHIAHTEGISALYEGLGGEVCKGFLSHGLTMIVKEAVHKVIIQLYYSLLRLSKQYPGPQDLAEKAQAQAQHGLESVRTFGTETLKPAGENLANKGKGLAANTIESGKATANTMRGSAESGFSALTNKVEGGYDKGQELAGKVLTSASETKDVVADYVGTEVEDLGRAIKAAKGGADDT